MQTYEKGEAGAFSAWKLTRRTLTFLTPENPSESSIALLLDSKTSATRKLLALPLLWDSSVCTTLADTGVESASRLLEIDRLAKKAGRLADESPRSDEEDRRDRFKSNLSLFRSDTFGRKIGSSTPTEVMTIRIVRTRKNAPASFFTRNKTGNPRTAASVRSSMENAMFALSLNSVS